MEELLPDEIYLKRRKKYMIDQLRQRYAHLNLSSFETGMFKFKWFCSKTGLAHLPLFHH